jgi:hypothetical protein
MVENKSRKCLLYFFCLFVLRVFNLVVGGYIRGLVRLYAVDEMSGVDCNVDRFVYGTVPDHLVSV